MTPTRPQPAQRRRVTSDAARARLVEELIGLAEWLDINGLEHNARLLRKAARVLQEGPR